MCYTERNDYNKVNWSAIFMGKKQNLLLVTEHYPCGTQELFVETEIRFLAEKYNVHVVCTDPERLMTRSLPRGVTFSRPAEGIKPWKRALIRCRCRFSQGYLDEKKEAKLEGRWTPEFKKHTLDALTDSRIIYDHIRKLDLFERDEPLVIYSANLNNYLYGLCCLKDFAQGEIKVAARCHNANMFDPITGQRRDTLNYVINRVIDEIYFTTEERKNAYLENFVPPDCDLSKYKVAPLGALPQKKEPEKLPPQEFFLRMVTCCPMEPDKRLELIIDALSLTNGCVIEWDHIGTGSQRNDLFRYAEQKLENKNGIRYKFLGKLTQEETYEFYRTTSIDLFLSVSLSESAPVAMMEAMANHIFVLATDVDGVRDAVNDKNGLLMKKEVMPEQLAEAFESLCKIPKASIAQKGEAAYESFQKYLNAEINYRAFADSLAVPVLEDQGSEEKAADIQPEEDLLKGRGKE